jgi:predicted amidohydrolase
MAKNKDAAVCGSIAITGADGWRRNRHYFITPDGDEWFYDKRHLFAIGGEEQEFVAGQKRCVAHFRGCRFLLSTCYDLRFPVWLRNKGDYDAIICVASWPQGRQAVWELLLRARAIENQCYVAGCNRVGSDHACQYRGGSLLTGPKGETVCACPDSITSTSTGTIDLEQLYVFREKFNVLDDRDEFMLVNNRPS